MTRFLPLLLLLGGCADPELEARVAQLETQVESLKNAPPAQRAAAGKPPANDARNEAAVALFREANQLVAANKYDEAKAKLAQLSGEYGDTPAAKSGSKVMKELEVIGKAAGPLQVSSWYQGETALSGEATLLVFWEVWCPHCKREVPKLQQTHDTWGPKGLQVIGLTKQTRNITDEQVESFIKENNVGYPMAKEAGGQMSTYYNVSGIPAAAVVKDGKVVWRGHPGRITDEMLTSWVGNS